jgi:hypothetical protein
MNMNNDDARTTTEDTVPDDAGAPNLVEQMDYVDRKIAERVASGKPFDPADAMARIIVLARQAGASGRTLAKLFGWSEPTMRRLLASVDADGSEKANEASSGDTDTASNDASPALKAILRNLPKLTAAERDVVRKELDIADIETAADASVEPA